MQHQSWMLYISDFIMLLYEIQFAIFYDLDAYSSRLNGWQNHWNVLRKKRSSTGINGIVLVFTTQCLLIAQALMLLYILMPIIFELCSKCIILISNCIFTIENQIGHHYSCAYIDLYVLELVMSFFFIIS